MINYNTNRYDILKTQNKLFCSVVKVSRYYRTKYYTKYVRLSARHTNDLGKVNTRVPKIRKSHPRCCHHPNRLHTPPNSRQNPLKTPTAISL